jgi:hypothetical protein
MVRSDREMPGMVITDRKIGQPDIPGKIAGLVLFLG